MIMVSTPTPYCTLQSSFYPHEQKKEKHIGRDIDKILYHRVGIIYISLVLHQIYFKY